jgi:hypothetical protein
MRCIQAGRARAEGGQGWVEQGGEGREASGVREGSGLGWEEKLQCLQRVYTFSNLYIYIHIHTYIYIYIYMYIYI